MRNPRVAGRPPRQQMPRNMSQPPMPQMPGPMRQPPMQNPMGQQMAPPPMGMQPPQPQMMNPMMMNPMMMPNPQMNPQQQMPQQMLTEAQIYQQRAMNLLHTVVMPKVANYKMTVGEFIFGYVEQLAETSRVPKITGMLLDLPDEDIQAYLTRYQ